MALDFTTFFGNFSSLPTLTNLPPALKSAQPPTFQSGYVQSSFMIIAQTMAKQLGSIQSILMDFSYLETDKNFSKSAVQPALDKGAGQVAGATQMNSLVKSQLAISGILQYIPTNVQNQLFNYQTLMTTNTNFLPVYQQKTTQSNMTAAVGSDLMLQYSKGNVSLSSLLAIVAAVEALFKGGTPTA